MSKSGWMPNSNTDFQTILGPVFSLFRCFGLEFHTPSTAHRIIFSTVMVGWTILTLGICGYKLFFQFPTVLINFSGDLAKSGNTTLLHWSIEFLSIWIYTLGVFIGSWCIAKYTLILDLDLTT